MRSNPMDSAVPKSLRKWFVVHFLVDVLFAIPLMLFPVRFLQLFGWQVIDPITTRLVAAALLGIGVESYLGRNAGVQAFRGMLNLKIIWSLGAIVGLGWSLLQSAQGGPLSAWLVLLVFVAFNVLWVHWRLKLAEK